LTLRRTWQRPRIVNPPRDVAALAPMEMASDHPTRQDRLDKPNLVPNRIGNLVTIQPPVGGCER